MDELLILVRALLVNDAVLLTAFQQAGASDVCVIAPDQRALAAYPRILLSGDEGSGAHESSDNNGPQVLASRLRLEIVVQQTVLCPAPLDTLRAIQARTTDLVKGDGRGTTSILPGIKGLTAGRWQVTRLRQARPTGMQPTTDPSFRRHLTTFDVELYRTRA